MRKSSLAADPWREEEFSSDVRGEYDGATIVGGAVRPHEVGDGEKGEFVRIGRRFYARPETFVEEYSVRGGTSYSSTILGLGRSIAIGEEKYLISKIDKALETVNVSTREEMLDRVDSSGIRFSAAFMPIAYYSDFHTSPIHRGMIHYEGRERFLLTRYNRIRPFWSSKYVQFDKFFFIGPDAFEWFVKPDNKTGHRVRISIVPNDEVGKFDVTCETVAWLKISDREGAVAFKLAEAPRDKP